MSYTPKYYPRIGKNHEKANHKKEEVIIFNDTYFNHLYVLIRNVEITQIKHEQKIWIDTSPKKNIQNANKYMKSYLTSLIARKNCKLKLKQEAIIHLAHGL